MGEILFGETTHHQVGGHVAGPECVRIAGDEDDRCIALLLTGRPEDLMLTSRLHRQVR